MAFLFCCNEIKSYKAAFIQHQAKFDDFMAWAKYPQAASPVTTNLSELKPSHVIQLVRQVNYGPLESKRYFAPSSGTYVEVVKNDLLQANFQKLNSYKNYRCDDHDKFFELNVYQKDPVNKHHWRVNLARPGSDIDL